MYSLQNGSIRVALAGGGWRLAGHDSEELFRKVVWKHTFCRADRVRVLLNALKKDFELAKSAELPEGVMENFGGVYDSAFKLYNRTCVKPVQRLICDAYDKIYGKPGVLTIQPFTLETAEERVQ